MIKCKIHESQGRTILACCDENLIGTEIDEEDIYFKVSKYFFDGETCDEEKLVSLLKGNGNINLVGEKTIEVAINNKFVSKDTVKYIKDIPHVQIYKI